ncbi:MAG: flippase-like domain-containing protein [Dehalococcoidia bacterium]|nr:flippase-like domain-containing protein [Dehalococcoidia bacterium]
MREQQPRTASRPDVAPSRARQPDEERPPDERGRRRPHVSVRSALQLAFTASLIGLILWRTDVGGAINVFRQLNPFFALAGIGLLISSNTLHALKWQKLLGGLGHVRLRELFAIFWSSMATNNVIPLRAGDVLRVQVLAQRTGLPRTGIVGTLLTERVLDAACFLLLLAIGVPALQGGRALVATAVVMAVLFFGILGATVMAARMERTKLQHRWWFQVLPRRGREAVEGLLPGFLDGLRPLGSWRSGGEAGALAVGAWVLEALAYWAFGLAFGLELAVTAYVVVMVAVNFSSAVTILPANLGLYELTAVGVMTAMGASGGEATAYAIGSHLLVIFTISGVGLLTLWYLRIGLEDIFYLRGRDPRGGAKA